MWCSQTSKDFTSESDERLIRFLSCVPFSCNPSLGSMLEGPQIDHDEHPDSALS